MFQIEVRNISKKYRYGRGHRVDFDTLGSAITSRVKNIFLPHNTTVNKQSIEVQSEHALLAPEQFLDVDEGWFWALKDISFNVQSGQRLGIYGKNGSGKSTLLKLMSRITSPSSGEIKYQGRLISLLEVGTGFHPDLSGADNIRLNAQINGMSRSEIDKKFSEIVEFSELGKQIETPIKRYSSGMYMRLAFAVAAHLESEILIVDEVLAVGDTGFQKKCMDKMFELANSGRTLIFVSHDLNAVEKLCNSCVVLENGRLISPNTDSKKFNFGQNTLLDGSAIYAR